MKNEVEDFLSQVSGSQKDDPFIAESDPLATKEEGTTSEGTSNDGKGADDQDGKPVPFHKDPKVQRYIEREIGKRIKNVQTAPVQSQSGQESEVDTLTQVLTDIIGNDKPEKIAAIKAFRAELGKLEERGAERGAAKIIEQQEAERAALAESREELITSFENIEEEFGVDLLSESSAAVKERNDFITYIRRVAPKDEDGEIVQYPDLIETYKIFKSSQRPADNRRAKDISSRSMSRSTDASTAPVKGQTWKDVDRIISKLTN